MFTADTPSRVWCHFLDQVWGEMRTESCVLPTPACSRHGRAIVVCNHFGVFWSQISAFLSSSVIFLSPCASSWKYIYINDHACVPVYKHHGVIFAHLRDSHFAIDSNTILFSNLVPTDACVMYNSVAEKMLWLCKPVLGFAVIFTTRAFTLTTMCKTRATCHRGASLEWISTHTGGAVENIKLRQQ